ncbi:MAG: hypothetical protein J5950_05345 [Clostridia bacterium]|nr:hypothetical protein [Clostridia bacterium]
MAEKAGIILTALKTAALTAVLTAAAATLIICGGCKKEKGIVRRDISGDTPYADSILYANDSANTVQVAFTDGNRSGVIAKNAMSSFVSDLTRSGNMGISYFANAAGKNYFTDSMDLYVIDTDGVEWVDRSSPTAGRLNTTRMGYYYYEAKIQEYSFGLPDPDKAAQKPTVKLADFTENWETNMADISQKAGESLTIKILFPTDAYVLKKDVNVPQDSVTTVKITMKVKGSAKTAFFYYTDSATNRFSERQKKAFTVSNDGEYHTYYLDISDALKGDLTSYRLEFQGEEGDIVTVTAIEALVIGTAPNLKTNKILHIFPDKIHQELRVVAASKVENIKEYGLVLRLPENTVDAMQIRDAAGVHSDLDFDTKTVEYAAFHVKGAGVIGFIIPDISGNTAAVTVVKEDGYYVIRHIYGGSNMTVKSGSWLTLCNRLYNDMTDSFDGIDKAASIERDPLKNITVLSSNSECSYTGYDKIRGLYYFGKNGADFSTAYYLDNNGYKTSNVKVVNDSADDRTMYFCFHTYAGSLECATLADGEGNSILPIPIEVCKNFTGEFEDSFYDPTDAGYGDSYFPLVIKSGETVSFTEHHLYQNWGKFPLKQLSSIQFFVGYYHLSTGVSESNCIAPYYVYGKDGWILPDFRGCSSLIWPSQPQYNAVGITKLVSHYGTDGTYYQSEFTGSKINAYGPTYADIEYSYIADDGTYEYTVRHMEFPHTDESRTYYTLELKFLKDLKITEVRRDFTLLMFNSRTTAYHWFTYLGADGKVAIEDMQLGKTALVNVYDKLQKGSFWYTWNNITEPSHDNPLNYGVVVRDYDVKAGGWKWNGNFVVRNCTDGTYNYGYLTLDLGKTTFRKGDYIRMSFVLIPWGNLDWETYSNMELLYEDCVTSAVKVSTEKGKASNEKWLPELTCADNEAIFTVSGGRGNTPVRVDGFTSPERPEIYIRDGDSWVPYSNAVVNAYDGYMIHFNDDGTYGFSFVFKQESPSDSVTFRIVSPAGRG